MQEPEGKLGLLDNLRIKTLKRRRLASVQGRRPVTPAGGARAVPAGRGSSPPLPGSFGNTPGRHYDRSAIGSLDWDRDGGVTAAESKSQEARLELNGGVGSLPQEPRWNAGRRSAPRWARAAPRRVRMSWRLPAFRLPCFISLCSCSRISLRSSGRRAPSVIEPKPALPPGLKTSA